MELARRASPVRLLVARGWPSGRSQARIRRGALRRGSCRPSRPAALPGGNWRPPRRALSVAWAAAVGAVVSGRPDRLASPAVATGTDRCPRTTAGGWVGNARFIVHSVFSRHRLEPRHDNASFHGPPAAAHPCLGDVRGLAGDRIAGLQPDATGETIVGCGRLLFGRRAGRRAVWRHAGQGLGRQTRAARPSA